MIKLIAEFPRVFFSSLERHLCLFPRSQWTAFYSPCRRSRFSSVFVRVCFVLLSALWSSFVRCVVSELILYGRPWQGGRLVIHENSLLTFSGSMTTFAVGVSVCSLSEVCLSDLLPVYLSVSTKLCFCAYALPRAHKHAWNTHVHLHAHR